MFRLINPVQHYAWGAERDIPDFLGLQVDGRPWAELWIGAHPSAPSVATPAPSVSDAGPAAGSTGARSGPGMQPDGHPLDRLIAADPVALLGPEAVDAFGERLPYLAKLLAAGKPLSLQVHPAADHARAAHEREHAVGVPAGQRNYVDPHHKPEMLLALEPTLALAGFRDPDEAASELGRIDGPGIDRVIAALTGPGTPTERARAGFVAALALPSDDVAGAVERIRAIAQVPGPTALGLATILIEHHDDPGVVASFLLNSVELARFEGLYVGAGVVHAYVRGFGIEVMASSDNVLRAGLTAKRVDLPELMTIVDTTPAPADVVRPAQNCGIRSSELRYDTPAADFQLSVYTTLRELGDDSITVSAPRSTGPRIVVCLEGSVEAIAAGSRVPMGRGEAVFVGHDEGELRLGGHGSAAVVGVRG